MCETQFCIYPWFFDSTVVVVALSMVGVLVIWKVIKAVIDTIPLIG